MDLIGELRFFNRVLIIFIEKGFEFNAETWPAACWVKRFSKSLYGCLFSAWSAGWHCTLCCVSSDFFISGMWDFCFRVGLVLPDVSADVTVRTIYVLAACSSHQTYKGWPWRLQYTSHFYKQQDITWHILGLTGERTEALWKVLKRPLLIMQRFVFHFKKSKLKHALVQSHCCTVVTDGCYILCYTSAQNLAVLGDQKKKLQKENRSFLF